MVSKVIVMMAPLIYIVSFSNFCRPSLIIYYIFVKCRAIVLDHANPPMKSQIKQLASVESMLLIYRIEKRDCYIYMYSLLFTCSFTER